MSCENNRHKFFVSLSQRISDATGLDASNSVNALEKIYQAAYSKGLMREKPSGNDAELSLAAQMTKLCFKRIESSGLRPPTHSVNGLPNAAACFGYAEIERFLQSIEKKRPTPSSAQQVISGLKRKQNQNNQNKENGNLSLYSVPEIAYLAAELERELEEKLPEKFVGYLSKITDRNSLSNFDKSDPELVALAYDAARAMGLTEIESYMVTGELPADSLDEIEVFYYEGEYLHGFMVHGDNAKFLEEIGLARYVSGWGYHVREDFVKACGTRFSKYDARGFAKPELERKKIDAEFSKQRRKKIFDKAKATGQPQILSSYMSDDCKDPECGYDSVTVYAMPDGTTKTVRSHTY